MSWKNQTMVTAGKKAQITKLRNLGQVEKANEMEKGLCEIVSSQMAESEVAKVHSEGLKHVNLKYTVPIKRVALGEGLPWVEKYRPVTLADLIGPVSCYLRAFVKSNCFPLGMVFFGEIPGQGKTAGAKAFIRDYYVFQGVFKPEATFNDIKNSANCTEEYEGCWSPVMYCDASTTSDADVVINRVMQFMKTKSMWNPKGDKMKKFVFVDEANYLSYAGQGKLRVLMEKFPGTLTVCTTNKIGSIDPAIISRASGGVFEFKKPANDELAKYLKGILKHECMRLPDATVEEVVVSSASVRDALGNLQREVVLKQCQGD